MRSAITLIPVALTIWVAGASSATCADQVADRTMYGRADRLVAVRGAGPGARPMMARPMSARAEASLGYKYEHGLGVPQSFDVAVELYISAAERGDPNGQYLLGLMYDKGHGVVQDGILAHMWLNLAAAHASRRHREYFLRLRDAEASKMTPSQIITAQRLAVEWVPKP